MAGTSVCLDWSSMVSICTVFSILLLVFFSVVGAVVIYVLEMYEYERTYSS